MDPITQQLLMGAAGSGGAEKIYVEDVFSTWLYTGNGSTQTITNGIDLSGKGGLVWIKNRDSSSPHHRLFDTARGAENFISSNLANSQDTSAATLTSFNSSGFSLWFDGSINGGGNNFASWTFRKAAKFFDVVTYTGNGSSPRDIAHSLGSTPGCIIIKRTDSTGDWGVWHRGNGAANSAITNFSLNTTGGAQWTSESQTTMTSTTFQASAIRSNGAVSGMNVNGATYVAYLFAHDAGGFGDSGNESVIKCGTFSGTGFTDLGWEPQWLLIKPYNQTWNWEVYDNMRGMGQPAGASSARSLIPNLSNAEANGSSISFEATGFTQTTFGSSYPCIYIAIRRGPMKTPTDATKVFASVTSNAASAPYRVTGFPVDMFMRRYRPGDSHNIVDRLRGGTSLAPLLKTDSTAAEATSASDAWLLDYSTGVSGNTAVDTVYQCFRRAPGFFDVVAYTGNGTSNRSLSHNLSASPELIILKSRSNAFEWIVWTPSLPASTYLNLHTNSGTVAGTSITGVSSSAFVVGPNGGNFNSANLTYIAYLFASCPGVSKVGTYTGSGSNTMVDCGFTNGARFVLVKRTDSGGGWYVWDTARGIIAANDPYLQLNTTAAEVTFTDYIDPYSAGFTITSSAPADLNAAGGTFLFLAIA